MSSPSSLKTDPLVPRGTGVEYQPRPQDMTRTALESKNYGFGEWFFRPMWHTLKQMIRTSRPKKFGDGKHLEDVFVPTGETQWVLDEIAALEGRLGRLKDEGKFETVHKNRRAGVRKPSGEFQKLPGNITVPTTIRYPLEQMDYVAGNPRPKGRHAINWEICIGCGICAKVCPNKCLKMFVVEEDGYDRVLEDEGEDLRSNYPLRAPKHEGKEGKAGTLERPAIMWDRCLFCNFCCEYCPTGALYMTDHYELAHEIRSWNFCEPKDMIAEEFEPPEEVTYENLMDENPKLTVDNCTGCQLCYRWCPTGCISMADLGTNNVVKGKERQVRIPIFDYNKCIGCAQCVTSCNFDALHMVEAQPA